MRVEGSLPVDSQVCLSQVINLISRSLGRLLTFSLRAILPSFLFTLSLQPTRAQRKMKMQAMFMEDDVVETTDVDDVRYNMRRALRANQVWCLQHEPRGLHTLV